MDEQCVFGDRQPLESGASGAPLTVTVVCWLLLLGLGTWTWSQEAGELAPGPLVFTVVKKADGAPVGDVFVQLGGRFAATSKDGTVTLDGVPAGEYGLRVRHPGFAAIARRLQVGAGAREPLAIELVACLKPGNRRADQHLGCWHFSAARNQSPVEGKPLRVCRERLQRAAFDLANPRVGQDLASAPQEGQSVSSPPRPGRFPV